MAYHLVDNVVWRAGTGTPIKYGFGIDAYVDITNITDEGIATVHVTGLFSYQNHPLNSQNSFAASDYAYLVIGNADPWNYPWDYGTSYYQRALPFAPNAPQSVIDNILVEFRGDTWRYDPTNNLNKVSIYYKPYGIVCDKFDQEVNSTTWVLDYTFTIDVSSGGNVPILTWATSGCNSSTDYNWVNHWVWVSYFDISWDAKIQYNSNGGPNTPNDTTKTTSGSSTTLTVTNSVPTWDLHRFEGWATTATGSAQYHAGDTLTILKTDPTKTLYAVWTEYYRPGKVRNSGGTWLSHQRSVGKANIYGGSSWVQMDTIDGATGTTNPPKIKHSGGWKNMRRIGQE